MPPSSRGRLGGGWGPRSSGGIGPIPTPDPPLEGEGASLAEERLRKHEALPRACACREAGAAYCPAKSLDTSKHFSFSAPSSLCHDSRNDLTPSVSSS